jgi:anti-sigma-K factor RskA
VAEGVGAGTVLTHLPDRAVAILDAQSLDPLDPSQTYQIWTLRGKDVASMGTFMVNADGTARIAFSTPLNAGDKVAITIEPFGGSPRPTAEPILVINITADPA